MSATGKPLISLLSTFITSLALLCTTGYEPSGNSSTPTACRDCAGVISRLGLTQDPVFAFIPDKAAYIGTGAQNTLHWADKKDEIIMPNS